MTVLPRKAHQTLEIDPHWCWSRLAAAREGLLSFSSYGTPATLPVAYAVDRQRVIIAMAPGHVSGWRADGSKVTLEIAGADPGSGRWFVRASGRVRRDLSSCYDAALLASPLEPPRLPSDPPPHQLTMPLAYVRGFYEPADHDRRPIPGERDPWRPSSRGDQG